MRIRKFQFISAEEAQSIGRRLSVYSWTNFRGGGGGVDEVGQGIRQTIHGTGMGLKLPRVPTVHQSVDFDAISTFINRYLGNYTLPYHHDDEVHEWSSILCLEEGTGSIEFIHDKISRPPHGGPPNSVPYDGRPACYSYHLLPGEMVLWNKSFNDTHKHGGILGGGRMTLVARWR